MQCSLSLSHIFNILIKSDNTYHKLTLEEIKTWVCPGGGEIQKRGRTSRKEKTVEGEKLGNERLKIKRSSERHRPRLLATSPLLPEIPRILGGDSEQYHLYLGNQGDPSKKGPCQMDITNRSVIIYDSDSKSYLKYDISL